MGMNEEYESVELDVVTLTDEDGKEEDYAVVLVFPVNDITYAALCPIVEGDIIDDENITFFRYAEEGDEVSLDDLGEEEAELVAREYEMLCAEDEEL